MASDDPAEGPPQQTLAQLTTVSANDPGEDQRGLFGPKRKATAGGEHQGLQQSAVPRAPAERVLLLGLPHREAEAAVRHGAGPGDAAAGAREQRQRQRDAVLDHRDRGAPRCHLPDRRYAARGHARPGDRILRPGGGADRPHSGGRHGAGPLCGQCRRHVRADPERPASAAGREVHAVGRGPRGPGHRGRAGHVHRRPRPAGPQGAPDGRVPRTRAARMASRRATCSRSGAAPSGCPTGASSSTR